MAHVGKKLGLVLVGDLQLTPLLFDLTEKPCVMDGKHRLCGKGLKQFHYLRREFAGLLAPDDQSANKSFFAQQWHREHGAGIVAPNADDAYAFDAINHLFCEAAMREAGMQEFFSEAGITPLTVVYEDFVADYPGTLRRVLNFLGLDSTADIPLQPLAPTADDVNEAWVQRFRVERQQGWQNRGW